MMSVVNLDSQTSLEDQSIVICAGCGTRILDRYFLLVADKHWHVPCLRCVDCNIQLDSQLTCFARDGNIFCKSDYYRYVYWYSNEFNEPVHESSNNVAF